MLRMLARARRGVAPALLALVATAPLVARAQDCTIANTDSQVVLYRDAHFVVAASPAADVTVDLTTDYPPPPTAKAPYVYDTNFHPASGTLADAPLLVKICPVGVTENTVWNLQASMDDLVDPVDNQSISATKVAYSRRLMSTWTTLSNDPLIVYTGVGSQPVTLALYFQVWLDGSERAGAYRGALHLDVLAAF